MALMTDAGEAIFNAANKNGTDEGTRILKKTWRRVADRTCMSSSAEGSTARSPRVTLTSVGKKEMMAAIKTFGVYPLPKRMTRIGAIARTGTVYEATANGYSARSSVRLCTKTVA